LNLIKSIQKENNQRLVKILEYLECPQYLRKSLFAPHKYLEHVGLLAPLEAPHHFKLNDEWQFREGVVTDIPSKEDKGSWIDVGLLNVRIYQNSAILSVNF
jgi:methyltransferase